MSIDLMSMRRSKGPCMLVVEKPEMIGSAVDRYRVVPGSFTMWMPAGATFPATEYRLVPSPYAGLACFENIFGGYHEGFKYYIETDKLEFI